jgi:hypothetical protein
MHHVCKPKRMLTGLLAVVLAGFFVQAAVAFTVDQNSSGVAGGGHALRPVAAVTTSAKTPLVIPYLSHGVGVDQSLYGGQGSSSTPLVIPYMSHGVGVEQSLYSGTNVSHSADAEQSFNGGSTAQPSDVFTRAVARHEALIKAMNATAAKSSLRPDDRAGALGIGNTAASQSQSTAVRPDDRVGTRGIGTISGNQATSSSSSTDWSAVLMGGGALLGLLLIVAAAVAVSRRQQGRLVAH